ncbi:acyl-CoA dehydrogenase family protein [Arthrobacter burdickii]|uniref:Acyl-CoA dehydrogenase family protein n=1 Tax=Arthrobacter burdickii TaxID=3035920 RepID=A0ABT8JX69_9MICC|nr:acyl-CoA dehydrogenase family protein [Arthrobacter burdickii]MDN4609537.1 acyl-CoA dehydrogenase family protein [Arthrobacter burdickii]
MSLTIDDTTTTGAPRSPWHGNADAQELNHWRHVARQAADELATDALERDRANQDPFQEVELLRRHNLINLLVPKEAGGAGAHWETAFHVIRILATTDGSIAQLVAYHYINQGSIVFYGEPAAQADWLRRSADGQWVWGDSVNPVDPTLELTPDGDGYRLNGFKRFSTGSSVGDVIIINALVRGGTNDGKILAFVLERGRAGLELQGDWDFLGQRLSASGSVRYNDVAVRPEDILGEVGDEPFSTLVTPGIQLAFGNFYLGVAQGALAKGRDILRGRTNSWFLSSAETYAQDPIFQRTVGELLARTAAVEALAGVLNRTFDDALAKGAAITAEERAELAILIAQLKVVSTEVGLDVAHRIFEVTGSSSTSNTVGLDLFWRNIRTHSLHDPVDYKKIEVGANYLLGEVQPISLYT